MLIQQHDKIERFRTGLCFDDVLLVPQFSETLSRKEISLESSLGNFRFDLPIISSPMDTVTSSRMAAEMSRLGGLGIIHRYNSISEQVSCVRSAKSEEDTIVGAAVGVSGDYIDRACALYDAGASIICVDIAHGHHVLMRHALGTLRNTFGTAVHIMAGNVATLDAFNDLADWGADSIRVGIGGGSICSTRIKTGHGMPTFQSVLDCAQTDRDANLIADGGIKTSGDVVKALAAGADLVMLGSLLAGTNETPGEIIFTNGERHKTYRGMASAAAQIDWRGHTASLEGVSTVIPAKGSVEDVLLDMERGVSSGLSYSGATSITALQSKSQFMCQTNSGAVESSTHIKLLV